MLLPRCGYVAACTMLVPTLAAHGRRAGAAPAAAADGGASVPGHRQRGVIASGGEFGAGPPAAGAAQCAAPRDDSAADGRPRAAWSTNFNRSAGASVTISSSPPCGHVDLGAVEARALAPGASARAGRCDRPAVDDPVVVASRSSVRIGGTPGACRVDIGDRAAGRRTYSVPLGQLLPVCWSAENRAAGRAGRRERRAIPARAFSRAGPQYESAAIVPMASSAKIAAAPGPQLERLRRSSAWRARDRGEAAASSGATTSSARRPFAARRHGAGARSCGAASASAGDLGLRARRDLVARRLAGACRRAAGSDCCASGWRGLTGVRSAAGRGAATGRRSSSAAGAGSAEFGRILVPAVPALGAAHRPTFGRDRAVGHDDNGSCRRGRR